jgi:hypothetical protein
MIAQVKRIIRYKDQEYRLRVGEELSDIPEALKKSLKKAGYINDQKTSIKEGGEEHGTAN